MEKATVTIGAEGIDNAALIRDAEAAVARKREDGTYQKAKLDGKWPIAPLALKDDDVLLDIFLESLREAAFVDINDFEIEEKRPRFSKTLVRMKKTIWGMLKFYTYHLWSQQNQINGLLLAAVEGIHEKNQEHVRQLEARIEALEKEVKR